MSDGWTETFGGGTASPADVQYRAFTIAADTTLQWPSSNEDQPDVTARRMDVTASVAGLNLTMPAANLASTGENCVIKNAGTNTFTLLDNDGGAITTIAAGVIKYVEVRDNSSTAGSWGSFTFGTGTSGADAAMLAGAGLEAAANLLRQALTVQTKNASYLATANDRATLLEFAGGVETLSLTAAATLGNDWFLYVANQGSGTLTVDPNAAETIDGAATIAILQGESCMIMCDGTKFVTVGRGRSVSLTTSSLSLSVAGGAGTTTLTTAQVAAQVQEFTGALTGNRILEYGTAPGFWYVYNNTTGAFSSTLRVNGGDAGVAITQGTHNIVVSNGTNMVVALSVSAGTVTSVATGTGLTGGPITSTGTVALANTAVTPGSYDLPTAFTVDAQGRITSVTSAFASTDVARLSTSQTFTGAKIFSAETIFTNEVVVSGANAVGVPAVLAYAATVTPDFATGNNFKLTLTGNVILANPTNITEGQSGAIRIVQDATGSRTISFGSNWKFAGGVAPTLSTAPNAIDILMYYTGGTTEIDAGLLSAFA